MQMVVSPSKYGNCYILVASEYFTGCPIHYTFEIAYYAFKKFNVPKFSLLATRADLRGVLGALKHPPPKFYNEQAKKLLEAVVQVQLHFIHMYGQ